MKRVLKQSNIFISESIETLQLFYFTFQMFMVKVTTTKTLKLRAVRQKRRNENKLWW